MKRAKRTLLRTAEILSVGSMFLTLLWWAVTGSHEPLWLFALSLISTLILVVPEILAFRRQRKRGAEAFEDLGQSPAVREQAVRDRERKRLRPGAYRTTIRVSLTEKQFILCLGLRDDRLGFQRPEILSGEDGRRVLLRPQAIFENRARRAEPNMEFDVSRLDDTGEVDVCAWAQPVDWILAGVMAGWGTAMEVIAFIHDVPVWFQLLLFLFIGYAIIMTPVNTRNAAKAALADLHLEWQTPFDGETEDEP